MGQVGWFGQDGQEKNGEKWRKMEKNGEKWRKIGTFLGKMEKKGEKLRRIRDSSPHHRVSCGVTRDSGFVCRIEARSQKTEGGGERMEDGHFIIPISSIRA